MTDRPVHLLVGPEEHGVVRFGRDLAALLDARVLRSPGADLTTSVQRHLRAAPIVHLHYTEALYGPETGHAATVFARLADGVRAAGRTTLAVTLHDLPDPDDEPARFSRRAAGYRRVLGSVDVGMVCSRHELARVEAVHALAGQVCPVPVAVVPMRVPPPPPPTPPPAAGCPPALRREVGVFGFVYPGKGHGDVLEAMAAVPRDVGFAILGRPADGHEHMLVGLRAAARAQGRRCAVHGFIGDRELTRRLREVGVPVVPGRAVSASGSLHTWLAAGRRPLTADGPYARELAARYPGAVQLYEPAQLPGLIASTLCDPARSWLREPPPAALSGPEVATAYARAVAGAGTRAATRVAPCEAGTP